MKLFDLVEAATLRSAEFEIVVNVDPYGDKLVSVDHLHVVDGQIVLDFDGDYYVRNYQVGE